MSLTRRRGEGRARLVVPGAMSLMLTAAGVAVAGPAGAATGALPAECVAGAVVTCTFSTPTASDAPILFDVPTGVRSAQISVRGAAGGAGAFFADMGEQLILQNSPGGTGGTGVGTVALDPAQDLEIRVGGRGGDGQADITALIAPGAGGLNGGGAGTVGSSGFQSGGGGGGGSEVRVAGVPLIQDPLIAAGGGGGGAGAALATGGNGGGPVGDPGAGLTPENGTNAAGGTQSAGGAGGTDLLGPLFFGFDGSGKSGGRGIGGDAGSVSAFGFFTVGGGGGGGGGYFGGGGGATAVLFPGSGAGGSGFSGTAAPFIAASTLAAVPPDGEVRITYTPPKATKPAKPKRDRDDDDSGPVCDLGRADLAAIVSDPRLTTGC